MTVYGLDTITVNGVPLRKGMQEVTDEKYETIKPFEGRWFKSVEKEVEKEAPKEAPKTAVKATQKRATRKSK